MLSSIVAFISRHQKKIIYGSVCIGGAILCSKYAANAVKRIRNKEMIDYLDQMKKEVIFECSEESFNEQADILLKTLLKELIRVVGTDALVEELNHGKVENKVAAWERLKILAFTKIMTLVYASSMLVIFMRIQMSLSFGFIYSGKLNDAQSYRLMLDHFIENHLSVLFHYIVEKVSSIVGSKSLREKMKIRDIENIFWALHSAISVDPYNPCKHLAEFIIPKEAMALTQEDKDQIQMIMSDLMESNDVQNLALTCVSRGLTFTVGELRNHFRTEQQSEASFADLNEITLPMAKVIPIVNNLATYNITITDGAIQPNDFYQQWMQQLIMMESLKVLSANVYEAFIF